MDIYKYNESEFIHSLSDGLKKTKFEEMVDTRWKKAVTAGLFNYSLDDMKTRIVPGEKKYVLQVVYFTGFFLADFLELITVSLFEQLNEKRLSERRKPETFESCETPFDKNKFNFNKVRPEEVLFKFEKIEHGNPNLGDDHVIMINVSPLEKNHILLVPNVSKCIPQKLDVVAVQLSIELMLLTSNRAWRMGFNSLCALASVNHQHIHAWTLEHKIYLEHAKVRNIGGKNLYILSDECLQAFAFQLHGSSVSNLSREVFRTAEFLHSNNVPHNLFITRGESFSDEHTSTVRVFIFPRKMFNGCKIHSVKKQPFNVACAELSGHIPVYDSDAYERLIERDIDEIIRKEMISPDDFGDLSNRLLESMH